MYFAKNTRMCFIFIILVFVNVLAYKQSWGKVKKYIISYLKITLLPSTRHLSPAFKLFGVSAIHLPLYLIPDIRHWFIFNNFVIFTQSIILCCTFKIVFLLKRGQRNNREFDPYSRQINIHYDDEHLYLVRFRVCILNVLQRLICL